MFASSAGKPEFSKQLNTHSGAGVFQHPFEDQNKWSGFRVFPGTESRKHKGKPPASPTAHDARGARARLPGGRGGDEPGDPQPCKGPASIRHPKRSFLHHINPTCDHSQAVPSDPSLGYSRNNKSRFPEQGGLNRHQRQHAS